MSELEFVGKMNFQPFISLAKEEQMRIDEIKRRILKKGSFSKIEMEPEVEFTYERYAQNEYE